ncbi:hypothetical protein C2E23DRAFT_724548 [Lenzites betulinus]|nr:hypothetical protein C2E23DRAFT_724548 [Lenzites betulinus]
MPVRAPRDRTRKGAKHSKPLLHAYAILSRRNVEELKQLENLRRDARNSVGPGRIAESSERQEELQHRRASGLLVPSQVRTLWSGETAILRELNAATAFVPRVPKKFKFLDIGCAPGGFSLYILHSHLNVRGVGIVLPEFQGSEGSMLRPTDTACYKHIGDPSADEYSRPATSLPRLPDTFYAPYSLVYMDGRPVHADIDSPSDPYTPEPPPPTKMSPTAIAHFIGQLLVTLGSVELGGTIVMRLAHIERAPAAQLVYLLDMISETLVLHQPQGSASFYAVAKGVGADTIVAAPLLKRYIKALHLLWDELSTGAGLQRGRLVERELGRVIPAPAVLESRGYLDRLVELASPVWAAQARALRDVLQREGTGGGC